MSYYNTTHSTGKQRQTYEAKASSQEKTILQAFKEAPTSPATPSQMWIWLGRDTCLLTSIRRAMSNLTNAGDLIKTTEQTKGEYGRPEYKWRLAEKHFHQQEDLFTGDIL